MIKIFFTILFLFFIHVPVFSENALITVDCGKELGKVNKMVFGNNFIGYDPAAYEQNWQGQYYGYSDYGSGVWDAKSNEPVKETVSLAKEAGIKVLRFPGGCGTHHYDWKKAVGKERQHFLFGIDEFLKTCVEVGAEPVLTLSYFIGNEQDGADLVSYLKAANAVKYFEFGNEDWHGDHRKIKEVLPEDYAFRYLKYYTAMKAVDQSIKIGVILCAPEWDKKVMGIIKDKLDFGIVHVYPSAGVNKKDFFNIVLNRSIGEYEKYFQDTLRLLKKESGRDIPLAITEYNAGFVQDKPVPYRHCLGTALVNAELLRVFMKPQNNIMLACYWQFANSYWGMIANGFDGDHADLNKPYYKRPNYFVYELYNNCFGDVLIDTDAKGGLSLAVNASKSADGNILYLMVINKNMNEAIDSTLELKDFIPAGKASARVLNGPSVDSTNEAKHDEVKVTQKEFDISGNTFHFNFAPHSLTALEIRKKTQ